MTLPARSAHRLIGSSSMTLFCCRAAGSIFCIGSRAWTRKAALRASGYISAVAEIHPDDWFLVCHFVDDRVMPGTLMYESCLQALRILLLRIGWVGRRGQVAFEPVPEVTIRLKCRGQVVESTSLVTYEVTITERGYRDEPFAIADALVKIDGKPIVELCGISLQLSGSNRHELESLWKQSAARSVEPAKRATCFSTANAFSTSRWVVRCKPLAKSTDRLRMAGASWRGCRRLPTSASIGSCKPTRDSGSCRPGQRRCRNLTLIPRPGSSKPIAVIRCRSPSCWKLRFNHAAGWRLTWAGAQ